MELGGRQRMINLEPLDVGEPPVEPTHSDAWIEANSDSLESVLESLEVADPAPNLARAAAARNAA
jgi:hypothetical protein